ncbi:MAG: ATP-binding protein [Lachnospiraceae bacterium]|nr:ATP-binding protein [Lachnospiraceae bacterium]
MEDFSFLTTKEFDARLENLPEVAVYVKGVMSECGIGRSMIASIDIAVEEVYVNIATYAYDEGASYRPVWVSCGISEDDFILVFRDEGVPYDPLQTEDPETEDPSKMTIGGYGIFMVKTIADSVTYEYDQEKGQNVLVIKKKVE